MSSRFHKIVAKMEEDFVGKKMDSGIFIGTHNESCHVMVGSCLNGTYRDDVSPEFIMASIVTMAISTLVKNIKKPSELLLVEEMIDHVKRDIKRGAYQ